MKIGRRNGRREVQATKACGQCKACLRWLRRGLIIEMENTLNASFGDVVEIELRDAALVKASLIMYGIPLLD